MTDKTTLDLSPLSSLSLSKRTPRSPRPSHRTPAFRPFDKLKVLPVALGHCTCRRVSQHRNEPRGHLGLRTAPRPSDLSTSSRSCPLRLVTVLVEGCRNIETNLEVTSAFAPHPDPPAFRQAQGPARCAWSLYLSKGVETAPPARFVCPTRRRRMAHRGRNATDLAIPRPADDAAPPPRAKKRAEEPVSLRAASPTRSSAECTGRRPSPCRA